MSAGKSAARVVVAGLSGEAGKTLLSLAVILEARRRGVPVCAFKKGPDYIDAAWLSWASQRPARNLDTFLMGFEGAAAAFARHSLSEGLNVIEGNRGLFDGADPRGTHSTAELAKQLAAPVILVADATKRTRSVSACVLGCRALDPEVRLAGVILNRVAGERHQRLLREAIEADCGVPVLGAIPRLAAERLVPGRHLGLITPEEYPQRAELERTVAALAAERLAWERLFEIARSAPPLAEPAPLSRPPKNGSGLRIGYLRDSAFTFYYPENLEALESAGAKLEPIPSLRDQPLPEGLHALYVGGGFPETHAGALSANRSLLGSLRQHAMAGLPIYAECGGLMLLARAIHWQGRRYPMADVLPFEVEVCGAPQGHGYAILLVERANPYYPVGLTFKGHEFHYSRLTPDSEPPPCACAVQRGTGAWRGRDGFLQRNVWASYTHVHAAATPEWAAGLIAAARRYREGFRASDSSAVL